MYKPFLDLTDEQKEVAILTMMDVMLNSFNLIRTIESEDKLPVIKNLLKIQNEFLKIMVEKIGKKSEEMQEICDLLNLEKS